jgi:hypothetical protein
VRSLMRHRSDLVEMTSQHIQHISAVLISGLTERLRTEIGGR